MRSTDCVRALSLAALAVLAGFCRQAGGQQPEFEVISVKPSPPAGGRGARGGRGAVDPGLFSVRNRPLKGLILMAYDIADYQLSGGPAWIENDRWDVDARPAAPTPREQMMPMLRTLLADRFHLVVHHETKPLVANVLTVAKGGPKFGPQFHQIQPGAPITMPAKGDQGALPLGGTIRTIASMLGSNMRLFDPSVGGLYQPDLPPVLDQTGLAGEYEVTLRIDTHEDWASILDRQLGLKLELRKVPMDMIVIESASKPSGN